MHNILEPSVFGLPVIFGPKFDRFPEATEFISAGIGFSIRNAKELQELIIRLGGELENIKVLAKENVKKNSGAAELICDYLNLNESVQ